MPWSNQSGGPWGSGPQSRGPKPPDLEEFLRRSQDRLRGLTPGNVGDFLFNVQSPESTVKAVGESVMRAVIGHSNIQGILTGERHSIETAVQEQMQKTLDDYGAGVVVQQIQLQRVDPPTQVIEAFRDVQRASSDLERAQNEV